MKQNVLKHSFGVLQSLDVLDTDFGGPAPRGNRSQPARDFQMMLVLGHCFDKHSKENEKVDSGQCKQLAERRLGAQSCALFACTVNSQALYCTRPLHILPRVKAYLANRLNH
jgi:hypothetical protein